jgi:hypothetical protein
MVKYSKSSYGIMALASARGWWLEEQPLRTHATHDGRLTQLRLLLLLVHLLRNHNRNGLSEQRQGAPVDERRRRNYARSTLLPMVHRHRRGSTPPPPERVVRVDRGRVVHVDRWFAV